MGATRFKPIEACYMDPLLILTTGGTIDKVHDTRTEELVFTAEELTQIPELLEIGRCYFPSNKEIMQKDSLDMGCLLYTSDAADE